MLERVLQSHVLVNLVFLLVISLGFAAYLQMPREQYPEINFNWINIITTLPGASAGDVEHSITEPLEEAINVIAGVRYVRSNSREGISKIVVRFNDIDERTFDKKLNELRRDIQNKANEELPEGADPPLVTEVTSGNSMPTAMLVLQGSVDSEALRLYGERVKRDLRRTSGVNGVRTTGLHSPELLVEFFPERLQEYGISVTQLSNTIKENFRNVPAGVMSTQTDELLVRVVGASADPEYLAALVIPFAKGEVRLSDVARISRTRSDAEQLVRHDGKPAVLIAITKKANTNTLQLLEALQEYVDMKNLLMKKEGMKLVIIDDQTVTTRVALSVMKTNAALGLLLVFAVTYFFVGFRIACFLGAGILFSLAGTFYVLNLSGVTLNISTLLGLVIVLGMIIDDAVVVVESIYYYIQRGERVVQAVKCTLREVFTPVAAASATTVAAFLPLMLLPGVLGDFMFVVPFVVVIALIISLIEAFWILPVHVAMISNGMQRASRFETFRGRFTYWIRVKYSKLLVAAMRKPLASIIGLILFLVVMIVVAALGGVKADFFASDPVRLFYVNITMPPSSSLDETMKRVYLVEEKVRAHLHFGEARGVVSIAGQMYTETEPFWGDRYGQVIVSLNPINDHSRSVDEIIGSLRDDVILVKGEASIVLLSLSGGPPSGKDIKLKIVGDEFGKIEEVANHFREMLESYPFIHNIRNDDAPGKEEIRLNMNQDALNRFNLLPSELIYTIRLLFDGDVVASVQDNGEKIEVRVRSASRDYTDVPQFLQTPIALEDGGYILLGQVVDYKIEIGKDNIKHYDFQRAITLTADLDKTKIDTISANKLLLDEWNKIRNDYISVDLVFTGALDDIKESIGSLAQLLMLGVGLVYLILSVQFRSYFQPLMILASIPLAFSGVLFGLLITQNPLSLYTLYGVVGLVGLSVNASIVMIDVANKRLGAGKTVQGAIIYAARRRVIPIIITSLTTIAGLFSLAIGLGGDSLMWGPVASVFVWGLGLSTLLTLFIVPLFYQIFMRKSHRSR